MSHLPISQVLWASNRPWDHGDHLHISGDPLRYGTPPYSYPGMTPAIHKVVSVLNDHYGKDRWPNWGIWNRRRISGSRNWSQHAYANAVDIGPLYGVSAQRPYYNLLVNHGIVHPTDPPPPKKEPVVVTYRTIRNVPSPDGRKPADWAKAVVDWAISARLVAVDDNTPDDWNKTLTDGRYWTFEHRRRND